MRRRGSLGALLGWGLAGAALPASGDAREDVAVQDGLPDPIRAGRPMRFPGDHGAHLGARIEWWYVTGHFRGSAPASLGGFQLTFFRFRTGVAQKLRGRFAPRHLLFAHAALTRPESADPALRFVHAQRTGRWNGSSGAPTAHASAADADLALGNWRLLRSPSDGAYTATFDLGASGLRLRLVPRQPVLLQGEAGYSRKGPAAAQSSHYYSEPQLAAQGVWLESGRSEAVSGLAWLDHEWSDSLLAPGAEGWDWIGMNFLDGAALTAFRIRGQGSAGAIWAGGSFRSAAGALRVFAAAEVVWRAGRRWRSPTTGADYPVEWQVQTPVGTFHVRALSDAQELDSRASTGTVYWEGLSELVDGAGLRLGLGYLEMTGYAGGLAL